MRSSLVWALCLTAACLVACGGGDSTTATPAASAASTPANGPTFAGAQSVGRSFELLGGYRLRADFANEGLALVRDADGFVVEAIAGANVHTSTLNVYDLRGGHGAGTQADGYPILEPMRRWGIGELFPNFMERQNLRDVAVHKTAAGYELYGIGRVFYNTMPRGYTQINVRELLDGGARLGPTREIPVDLPEQEFSGFIKHAESARDSAAIGAGSYDSGQGSVGGLSYALQQADRSWKRILTPPAFGDIAAPRLPRDPDYSCPGGSSWVCIEPVNGKGIWSTERIGGGGVKYGENLLFIAMLGYGERHYGRQSYTFGDSAEDKAVAYFFKEDAMTGAVTFEGYDRWVHANPGEPVLGVALGRIRGNPDLLLFVVKSFAWQAGAYVDGSVLQVFRIKSS